MSVAQPLLDVLARNAGFLTAHELVGWRLFWFTVSVGLGVPALLAGAFLALDRIRWIGSALAVVVLSAAGVILVLLALRRLLPTLWASPWLAPAIAGLLGILGGWLVFLPRTPATVCGASVSRSRSVPGGLPSGSGRVATAAGWRQ